MKLNDLIEALAGEIELAGPGLEQDLAALASLAVEDPAFMETLDRYSGDGLVAFWGAPLDCPEQADQAVSAALDMLDAIARFNVGWTAAGHAPVRVRIGIESGLALVGDLGTPFRSTYTAVGDCINFASRLEAAARDLPVSLVIGASARSRLKKHQTYPLTTLQVRGTERVLEVFSVQPPA